MKYIPIIKPDCRVEIIEAEEMPELDVLQELVDGYIETVSLKGRDDYIGIVNEEGKLRGLDFNLPATHIVDYDSIAGNMLILKVDGEDLIAFDTENPTDTEVCEVIEDICRMAIKMICDCDIDT